MHRFAYYSFWNFLDIFYDFFDEPQGFDVLQ